MRLAKRLAFLGFDFFFGIVKGEQPLTRCGESGVQRQGGVFRLPPPYLWTPLSPQRVKGCSPLTIPMWKSKRKKASRCAKRFFLVSPICCFAADFTPLQNVKFCESVTPSAEPYTEEVQKMRLAKRLAFLCFDNSFGV